MIRLRQLKISIDNDELETLRKKCSKLLRIDIGEIKNIIIHDKSLDARKKPNLYFVYTIDVEVKDEEKVLKKNISNDIFRTPKEEYVFNIKGNKILQKRPIIVGSGPAGLFCAYILARYNYKPIIIERGEDIDNRIKTVEEFWKTGKLNKESNVQFGEGGAGTFSDGKLVSQVKDTSFRKKKIFEIFVANGAPNEIMYLSKPHIGTDKLRNIVKNIREEIINMGGEFRYNTCLTDIKTNQGKIHSVQFNNKEWIDTDVVVLALGHSARDTFKMLYDHNIKMSPKPFAVGIRIQHNQELINKNQYGLPYHDKIGAASYKLTYKATNGRGVYSFCMCPGGYVVNASSEDNKIAINGMSNYQRNSGNANSALIVTITPNDYGTNPLDGIIYQRKLEERAYQLGHGKIPVQLYKDYCANKISNNYGKIQPVFKGEYTFANINELFNDYINDSLKEAIEYFNNKIHGYSDGDSIIAGVESRTSSPIRIERNELGVCNIDGIYPCGEGAGYAGGITSAAIDGIKVAEFIANIYKPFE